jgi:predicted RNase H-like HicB family nuclease
VRQIKIVVEKHTDGYVAYPLGVKGVVVGEGDTYEEALKDVRSALAFHLETFGPDSLDIDPQAGIARDDSLKAYEAS